MENGRPHNWTGFDRIINAVRRGPGCSYAGVMTISHRDTIVAALRNAGDDLGDDRLAFLALTSKPELQIRDAIAWRLHQALAPDVISSREWHRADLALLDIMRSAARPH